MYNQNDDLKSALTYNKPEKFTEEEVEEILAEVIGEHDGSNWWWILKLTGKRFALLSAGCDYTGWDCSSGIYIEEIESTALRAAKLAPEDDSGRFVRRDLIRQLKGTLPFGVYERE